MQPTEDVAGIGLKNIEAFAVALDRGEDDARVLKGNIPRKADDNAPEIEYPLVKVRKSEDAQGRHDAERQRAYCKDRHPISKDGHGEGIVPASDPRNFRRRPGGIHGIVRHVHYIPGLHVRGKSG